MLVCDDIFDAREYAPRCRSREGVSSGAERRTHVGPDVDDAQGTDTIRESDILSKIATDTTGQAQHRCQRVSSKATKRTRLLRLF